MDRRGFLQALGIAAGGILLDEAIPFNRVWSFPKKILWPRSPEIVKATIDQYYDYVSISNLSTIYYDKKALKALERNLIFQRLNRINLSEV